MCLIERVVTHDDAHIICTSSSHRAEDNPLRTGDGLAAVHGIEYGAQAMALHSRLAGHCSMVGAIVTARDIEMRVKWLCEINTLIRITATLVMDNDRAANYRFSIEADDQLLVSGQLTVAFLRTASA